MQIGYIGGIVQRGNVTWPEVDGWQRWHWQTEDTECCLIAGGAGCRLFDHGELAVLLRGAVVDTRSEQPRCWLRATDRAPSPERSPNRAGRANAELQEALPESVRNWTAPG